MIKNVTKLNLNFWIVAVLVIANLIWLGLFVSKSDHLTHIYFLDVGHGDSILITTSNQKAILIDGGPSADVVADIDAILPFWKRNIDMVILTHPHADHVTGLIEVARRFQVDRFLYTGVPYDTHTLTTLYSVVSEQKIDMEIIKGGEKYDFGICELNILYAGVLSKTLTDVNETSVVSEITCNEFNALFPADIGMKIEQQLIRQNLVHDIEVVKVGHQGSKYSTSQSFLDVIKPEIAVLTVGKNSFGHPHKDTLEKLKDSRANIFSTLENGIVEIVTDGERYSVITQK